MGGRWRRVGREASRFLAVGGVATAVAFVVFNGLVHGYGTGPRPLLAGHPYLGYVLANTLGMVVSYRGSRSWVFRDRPPRTADGGRTAFLLINAVTMLIPIACLWGSRDLLGLDDPVSDNVAANVVGLSLGLVARFYLFRTYVFQRPVPLPGLVAMPLQLAEAVEAGGGFGDGCGGRGLGGYDLDRDHLGGYGLGGYDVDGVDLDRSVG